MGILEILQHNIKLYKIIKEQVAKRKRSDSKNFANSFTFSVISDAVYQNVVNERRRKQTISSR